MIEATSCGGVVAKYYSYTRTTGTGTRGGHCPRELWNLMKSTRTLQSVK